MSLPATLAFYRLLGFEVTYEQNRPYVYAATRRGGMEVHFMGIKELDPKDAYSTCLVMVPEVEQLHATFADALRGGYGKLPIAGIPRITRMKPGQTRFTIVDVAGNSLVLSKRRRRQRGRRAARGRQAPARRVAAGPRGPLRRAPARLQKRRRGGRPRPRPGPRPPRARRPHRARAGPRRPHRAGHRPRRPRPRRRPRRRARRAAAVPRTARRAGRGARASPRARTLARMMLVSGTCPLMHHRRHARR
ncbi:hypothetical protein [Nannocystis pusilla]|uniref:hypothetical protein n=1 Tax=Nannocystis pusilla TaxID=889268 RepID=UPI003B780F82